MQLRAWRVLARRQLVRCWLGAGLFSVTVVAAGIVATAPSPVSTSQYGTARTGANVNESILTPRNVNVSQFGKVGGFPVDGPVYGQPLYLPAVNVPGKGTHDLVFAATEHDSVYAFDAQASGAAPPLWRVNFTSKAVTPVPANDLECPLIAPEVGITSTPVIDLVSGTLYVLARTKERKGALGDVYVQKLHALAITNGSEKFGGAVTIRAWTRGRGVGNAHGTILFDPRRENPRAGLLLSQGRVYLTWASSCDAGPYHGWVMAYDAHTLKQISVLNTSPDANDSGIWLSDTGPAADGDGNIYVATGNGRFDAASGGRDYGKWIPEVARNMATLNLRAFKPSLGTLNLQSRLSGRMYDDDANVYLLHGYFRLDAYASRDFRSRFEIFAAGENLLDRAIEVSKTPTTTLGQPRVARIGIQLRLNKREIN